MTGEGLCDATDVGHEGAPGEGGERTGDFGRTEAFGGAAEPGEFEDAGGDGLFGDHGWRHCGRRISNWSEVRQYQWGLCMRPMG